ncbi:Cold-responsive protein kinase 1 [Vitis vinifera]|uniref:Cold-responsive protein kinase 1 n=1 Tax=Vitis vinifera TaxID=29760 RepID=A0A438F9T5_VITVI|nr:Cold-responsive protein kinase 1 [Vitis vinifera]
MKFSSFSVMKLCKMKNGDHHQKEAEEIAGKNVRLFSYNALRSATRNFHPSNRIGRGGFGIVYRGVLRDGTQVAVKSLSVESKQGKREFLTEIDMISNIQHPCLVRLIGCCVGGGSRMLVYEYLENKSLSSALLRLPICTSTAHGLAFLHEEAEPELFIEISRPGYMAPEYALSGRLTEKADVYSFGVLMLEIISGRSSSKAAFGENLLVLVEWTWKLKEDNSLLDMVDPELVEYPEDEVSCFIKVALLCIQAVSWQRPTMTQVLQMLSKEVSPDSMALTRPGYYKHSDGGIGHSWMTSSEVPKRKQLINPLVTSTRVSSCSVSITQVLPR